MARRGRPPKTSRAEIIAATLEVIRERGIARFTTREIAARMGISEGSIFYHFADRKELVKAVFEETLRPLWEFRTLPGDPPTTRAELRAGLAAITASILEFLDSAIDVLLAAQADTELRAETFAVMAENDYGPHRGVEAVTGYLESAQRAGVADPSADARALAYLLISADFARTAQPRLVGHSRGVIDVDRIIDTVLAALDLRTAGTADPVSG